MLEFCADHACIGHFRPVPGEIDAAADRAIRLVKKFKQHGTDPGSCDWTLQCKQLEACISPATVAALRAVQQVWSRSSCEAALAPPIAGLQNMNTIYHAQLQCFVVGFLVGALATADSTFY